MRAGLAHHWGVTMGLPAAAAHAVAPVSGACLSGTTKCEHDEDQRASQEKVSAEAALAMDGAGDGVHRTTGSQRSLQRSWYRL